MATFYAQGIKDSLEAITGVAAAPTGTLKLAFMATSYTANAETDSYWSDISASIAAGTTVQTVAGTAINIDTTNDRVEIDFNDVTETPVTASTDKVVLYMDTGTPSTSVLICCADISTTLSPVGGDLTLVVNAEGLAAINY
jgi:hypothetical protein